MSRAAVILIIFGLIFVFIAVVGALKAYRGLGIRWKQVQGVVVNFETIPYKAWSSPTPYEVKSVYTYNVNGQIFKNHVVEFDCPSVMSANQISKYFGSINPDRVTVYYDSLNPPVSVLIKPNQFLSWSFVGICVILAILLLVRAIIITRSE